MSSLLIATGACRTTGGLEQETQKWTKTQTEQQAGTVEGRLQLVDTGGRVSAELPATIDVQSLTVPPEARLNRTVVTFSSSRLAGRCGTGETCYCCPNGWIVCTGGLSIARATNPR